MTLVIMLITFISAVIVFVTDRKNESSRWLALFLFVASMASLANGIQDYLPPFFYYNLSMPLTQAQKALIDKTNGVLTQLSEHFLGYIFFMYCVSYSKILSKKKKIIYNIAVITLMFISLLWFPITTNDQKVAMGIYKSYYMLLSIWSVPVVMVGSVFLFIATLKEKNKRVKMQRYRNNLIIFPLVISAIVNIYLLRAFGVRLAWQYNEITVLFAFVLFLIFSYKYGAMGIKLKLEKQFFLSILNNVFSGTTIFNHTLKNEILKISMSTENINLSLNDEETMDIEEIKDNIQIISNSTEYLMKMVKRIQDFSKEISIVDAENKISEIIESALINTKFYLNNKNIKVEKNIDYDLIIKCDAIHITEVIINIIKNACEALEDEHVININIYGNQKLVNIMFSDNGIGMTPEVLSKIFEPFFTTKHNSENFGLGLSYCYNVMQKHKSDFNIFSEVGKGTKVILSFPASRIVKFDENIKEGE